MSKPSENEQSQEEVVVDEAATSSEEAANLDPVAIERDSYKEMLQRLQADFENYKKRMQKQQSEISERANESLVQRLLPVLDTLDMAKVHESNSSLEQVSVSILDVLTKEGLEKIAAVGQPFDPTLHEAVAHEAGDGESHVSEELRAGYKWKGRVIRPAMVKVVG